jgi:lysophospholipase L1-like esterase
MLRSLPALVIAAVFAALASFERPVVAADKPGADAKAFFFKPNDRIVFLGDSITEQYEYSSYIELYLTTRFPTWNLTFINAGIGGDTANGGASRFKAHVLDEQPTAVTINFGMNDGGYGKFNPGANKVFVEKTEAMLKMAKDAGVRVALVSPNAVDRRVKTNGAEYVETQKQFYAPLAGLAEKYGDPFVDQYAITRAATDRMEKDDPKALKAKPYGDGFHTSPPGGLLMAHAILTGLKAPAMVSDLVVDVKSAKAETRSCKVDGVSTAPNEVGVFFTRTDDALPMPMQKSWLPMLPYTNELKDLNWYGLTVKGLPAGNYTVSIDGKVVARHSAKELAEGVNLGNATEGPIVDQGNKVLAAIADKNRIVHGRFRGILLGGDQYWNTAVGQKRRPEELARRMEEATAAQADIYKLARPVPHKFMIKPE